MSEATEVQHIKAIDQYTGRVHYGKVIASTKCYVTVEIKHYYGKDRSLVQKLFKRDSAMTCDTSSLNFYFIYPKSITEID